MTADEIIRALGGATSLSRELGASRSAISNWPLAGVPSKYWPALARIAASRKCPGITIETLEQHTTKPKVSDAAEAA